MNSEALAFQSDEDSLDSDIEKLFSDFNAQRAKEIDRALRKYSESGPTVARVRRMHRLCLLYANCSSAVDGYVIARAAVRDARRLGDRQLLRKALTVRGALRRMAGDLNSAIEDNVEAYEVARELNDGAILSSPASNLVLALGLLDLDDLALRLAEEALNRIPSKLEDFGRLISVTSLMLNTSNLLLAKNPRRALQYACDSESRLLATACGLTPSEESLKRAQLAAATMNQIVAAVNLGDGELAAQAVGKLRKLIEPRPNERVLQMAAVCFAVYEARYGDRRRGLKELQDACQSSVDEVAVEALRRLVERHEASGSPADAAEVLLTLQARLQSSRRKVALEELRRIEALEDCGEFQCETEKRLSHFAISSIGVPERLSAKLKHLEGIAVTAELREGADLSRAEHVYRVGKLCRELAAEAGCSQEIEWLAEVTGRLHDIGKCAIPDGTILSALPLSDTMHEMLREHSDYGARLIADADEPRLVQVVAAVRHHHERFDGNGYPSKLCGEEIPLLARIASICESYDAMLQTRVYRSRLTPTKALEEIERCAGTQFDPKLAGLFVRVIRRIRREQGDILEYLGAEARKSGPSRSFEQLARLTVGVKL